MAATIRIAAVIQLTGARLGVPSTPPVMPAERADERAPADSTEPTEPAEPIENTDPAEPIDPIDRADPTDPIDRIDPSDPMQSIEFCDQIDQRESATGESYGHLGAKRERLHMRCRMCGTPKQRVGAWKCHML